jgi:hypothetical protein
MWYGLWSFNIPEMFVDFIGPGLRLNPNLLKYWRGETLTIVFLFFSSIVLIVFSLLKNWKLIIENWKLYAFGILWFVLTLLPVLFLPLHKFSFYLTLPLVGVSLVAGDILKNSKALLAVFISLYILQSFITLRLTESTHWIVSGAKTAKRVNEYFKNNPEIVEENEVLLFYDTEKDKELPWLPSKLLKETLSDNNYFEVFHQRKVKAYYGESEGAEGYKIEARQFLGY